jgi:TetR/AcrR family transcriptional regulator
MDLPAAIVMAVTTESNWKTRVIERSIERAAASPGDRRKPESIARRALRPTTRIVQAAIHLAEESGTSSFTVQDVLQRADVSLQTFYRHFQGKDDLLLAVLEESVASSTAEWGRLTARLVDPVGRVEFIVKAPFSGAPVSRLSPMIVHEHIRLMVRYAREVRAADEPYHQLLTEAIATAQEANQFPGVDPPEEAEMIMALVLARFHNRVLGVVTRTASQEGNHLWAFCCAALSRNEDKRPTTRERARRAG